jgi:hypothetical protein
LRKTLFHIILLAICIPAAGQNSVLKDGHWFKVAVDHHGVYKLNRDQFNRMGFSGAINASEIKVYGYLNGMLPQSNAITRPEDLIELSIHVEDDSDGMFDGNDYILFYGEGPHKQTFVHGRNAFFLETNLYSEKNYYFITVSDGNGKRISSLESGSGGSTVSTYHDFIFHENNSVNILRSGREWFGENFDLNPQQAFEFAVPGIVENSELTLVSEVMSQSFNPSSFEISVNGTSIGEQAVPVINESQYGAKGKIRRDTLTVDASSVSAPRSTTQTILFNFKRAANGRSVGFLNFFSAHFERQLQLYNDQLTFRNGNATNTTSRFLVKGVSANETIWNITDPYSPRKQNFVVENNVAAFSSTSASDPEEYVVFRNNSPSPELTGSVANQNLRGMSTPDLLIITHPDLIAEANRLAEHRRSHNNYAAEVVTIETIYNEFSSGRQDVTAMRDFTRWLYAKDPSRLKYLLLFGKSTYDYMQRIEGSRNLVPTYSSRNSLSPLETYSSDDYFGFMEDSEGEWRETQFDSHSLEIGVGRLPVKSVGEARIAVDKILRYDLDRKSFGKWRKDIAFVADDGSNLDGFSYVHQLQANTMAEEIESNYGQFNTRKIFLGSYSRIISPNGETIPDANLDIAEEFGESLIINYTGHGSEKLWADERVLSPEDVAKLRNKNLPFLVTATCEFGRHDDPQDISTAENVLLKKDGGSIGLVTTARPVNSSTNYDLNQAFYNALFQKESGGWLALGEIFRRTKNNSTSGVANRNFSLLADPSMRLAIPSHTVVVDHIKTANGSDTLKALSTVLVKGRVLREDGETDSDFTGVLESTLFDKRTKFQTIGKNDPVFKYSQWFNPLFRGKASVINGSFEFSFVLPKNIAYEVNPGKLSLYAYQFDGTKDATGAAGSFRIGETESDPPADGELPFIQAFMGDSTFIDGGTVSANSTLVVRLKDSNGFNISNYGIGNTMMAVLDNDAEVYLINEHYLADLDDFTSGWVHYPLYDLPPGDHYLTVKAWDTHNNPAETTIHFTVSSENSIVIEDLGNYPNPFATETTVYFTHNRPGEDLEINLSIVNAAGMEIKNYTLNVPASTYKVDLLKFNDADGFGKNLPPGLYFARLKVRSLTDGSESMRVSKLILAN